jgi:hypothetical protein
MKMLLSKMLPIQLRPFMVNSLPIRLIRWSLLGVNSMH